MMRGIVSVVMTLAMCASLSAYAVQRFVQKPLVPLQPMSSNALDGDAAERHRNRQETIERSAREQEESIIAQLGLNSTQYQDYQAAVQRMQKKKEDLTTRRATLREHLAAQASYRQELETILTPEQFAAYLEIWKEQRFAASPAKKSN